MGKVTGYSTKVKITLLASGQKHPVSHIGNSGIMLSEPSDPIPAGNALLLISIDDNKKKYPVVLPKGIPGPNVFASFF
jgi:hypothetical protein